MTTGAIVTVNDICDAGYCGAGQRRWFESYGFDFRDVRKNGITEEALLATGDALAIRVVALKREREAAANG